MAFEPYSIDVSRYRTLSVLTVSGTISAGRALVDNKIAESPDFVEASLEALAQEVVAGEAALAERLDNKADLGLERSFDLLVDRIWVMLKARLEFWHCYMHDGIALLDEEQRAEIDLEHGRELAAVAKELLARLFGSGVNFLRLSYPQQAAHMAARLRYIETRGLEPEFIEIVGARPVTLARVCQRRYQAMVSERSARDNAVLVDLRPFRARIKGAAEDYANLLLATMRAGTQEWSEAVLKALRPMLSVERPGASGTGELEIEEPLEEPLEPELLDLPSELEPLDELDEQASE